MPHTVTILCPTCKGTGVNPDDAPYLCWDCLGQTHVDVDGPFVYDPTRTYVRPGGQWWGEDGAP
jgi:DnaJ-class molecular chaperone